MKKYRKYMNGVKAPDTLHQRLRELKAPEKKPAPWARYGAMAAALVLVCSLGGFSVWAAGINSRTLPVPLYPAGYQGTQPEVGDVGQPDIAPVDPGETEFSEGKDLGSYEYHEHDGMVSYCMLPYIEYGETGGSEAAGQIAADWGLPKGSTRLDLAWDEITALLGGADAVSTHLNWDGYELTGWAAWYEDGSFWGAYLYGYAGALDHFEFSVTAGQLPPTCIVYPGSVEQVVRGLTVTADKYDGEDGCSRRVSFMKEDHGYRFDLTATDTEQAELLVSRLVCRVADKGLALDALSADGAVPANPWEGGAPEEGDTSAYDLREAADPQYHAPAVSAIPDFVPDYDPAYEDGLPAVSANPEDLSPRAKGESWCGNSGETHTCPICGEVLPKEIEHAHGLSGDPLDPGGDSAPAESAEICGYPLLRP